MISRIFFGAIIWLFVLCMITDAVTVAKPFSWTWWADCWLAVAVAWSYLRKWRHWAK